MIRDYCVELQVKRDAEREKRITANKAEKAKILEDWKASKKMDQMRIAEIKAETGIRDKLRLEQIKEQRKYEKEEKMKKMRQQREMRKVQKEMEKDNMLMRKDIRERSSILVSFSRVLQRITHNLETSANRNAERFCSCLDQRWTRGKATPHLSTP